MNTSVARVAALYDIHGNLPALEAVLEQVREAAVDHIVVGGDVLPGPMARETMQCLLNLPFPVDFIYGNGEVAVLEHLAGRTHSACAGTVSPGHSMARRLRDPLHPAAAVRGGDARPVHPSVDLMLRTWQTHLDAADDRRHLCADASVSSIFPIHAHFQRRRVA